MHQVADDGVVQVDSVRNRHWASFLVAVGLGGTPGPCWKPTALSCCWRRWSVSWAWKSVSLPFLAPPSSWRKVCWRCCWFRCGVSAGARGPSWTGRCCCCCRRDWTRRACRCRSHAGTLCRLLRDSSGSRSRRRPLGLGHSFHHRSVF